ncbi:DUF6435 family protein [Vibrio campbellii]|uniref:DUF6435 family protein n=1 Tax=Vibrio campbellii TaxID=680 RepID=UPI00026C4FE8|nr:DUF6435 family protein [Vibrio campbellii]AXB34305.1 Lacal_2735 family protein [Vibrio campbellii]ELU51167.1 hypothetical protein B878_14465 [Vibrio campbellii CAIM 519 = NBRC 15631 = ATCC 25920]MCC8255736.1 DUF6435 family protein [Vibrio campbellii CAIM 333]RDX36145.1 Lacal_2735 family protein [Vibrio campbellii]HDM8042978.1 Lacal_2735 family protein [Vibrio campbellii]|tara:strand:+ start:239 stop:415 length:177 start_codon:yes stop_codon:yes gene_type:complete
MFSFFKNNSVKKLKKRHSMLCEQAMQAQRRGDIKTYSLLTAEAEEVFEQIKTLNTPQN